VPDLSEFGQALVDRVVEEILTSVQVSPVALPDHALTMEEAAVYLGVSKRHLAGLVARNEVPHRRLGSIIRFSKRALDEFLAG
jgi:excisionase family DNA binding protein